jgi:fumarate hydratase class II
MATNAYRLERDSMGEVRVPKSAYYGAQTQRAVENFPISGIGFPPTFIHALGLVKYAAACANETLGLLDTQIAGALRDSAREVIAGKHDKEFVVDIFQTGSGTSTNMNANEVIANRALELLGKTRGGKEIHPNDHVNMGQSSNDVIPSAIHIAALEAISKNLLPGLIRLETALKQKAEAFDKIVKIGRTHLNDATPIRLGQEFSGYARQSSSPSAVSKMRREACKNLLLVARLSGPASIPIRDLLRKQLTSSPQKPASPFARRRITLRRRRRVTPRSISAARSKLWR